jgi:predicted Zn finger-like uncharacterized protein
MILAITCPGCQATLRIKEGYAGRQMKCPRCEAVIAVPAEEGIAEEPRTSRPASSGGTRACPECGKAIALAARKCRYCRAWVEDDEEEDDDYRPRSFWKPCPRCGTRGAERVAFTFWGSFYGPALFSHVRCPGCGYGYNGKTGGSNLIPAIIFVLVPLFGILAILGGLAYLILSASTR